MATKGLKVSGGLSAVAAVLWWFEREFITHLVFDKITHLGVVSKNLVEYAPPFVFASLAFGLLAKRPTQDKERSSTSVAPARSVGGTGILARGGTVKGSVIEGFETGIDAADSALTDNVVRRYQGGGSFASDGRFAKLSNHQLATAAKDKAAALQRLQAECNRRSGANDRDAYDWGRREYEEKHGEDVYQLCAEILKRVGNVQIEPMTLTRLGGNVVLAKKAAGFEAMKSAAFFLSHLADRLTDPDKPTGGGNYPQ